MNRGIESERIGALFDHLAPDYDKVVAEKGWPVNKMLGGLLAEAGVAYPTALDLGAGTGTTTATILESAKPSLVTAVDVSKDMCEILRRRFAGDSRVRIAYIAIEQYFAETQETYDLITAVGVLHYNSHSSQIIQAAASALNTNGKLVFTYNPLIPDHTHQGEPVTHYEDKGVSSYRQLPETIREQVINSGLGIDDHRTFTPQPRANTAYVGGLVVATKYLTRTP